MTPVKFTFADLKASLPPAPDGNIYLRTTGVGVPITPAQLDEMLRWVRISDALDSGNNILEKLAVRFLVHASGLLP